MTEKKAAWQPTAEIRAADDLVAALAIADKFRSRISTLPILGLALIQTVAPDAILVSASDLTAGVTIRLGAKVHLNAAIAVPPNLVTALLAGQAGPVLLEMNGTGTAWRFCTRYGQDIVSGQHGDDFPVRKVASPDRTAPGVEALEKFDADMVFDSGLFNALQSIAPCMSKDGSRPALNGVAIFNEGDGCCLVATDGYRVAEHKGLAWQSATGKFNTLLLPASFVDAVTPILSTCASVTLRASENMLIVSGETQRGFVIDATCALIDARFPDYKAILPKALPAAVTLNAAEFLTVLSAAKLFAAEHAGATRLSIQEDGSFLVWTSDGQAGALHRTLAAEDASGKTIDIVGNVAYLTDAANMAVKALGAERVIFAASEPTRPMRITVAGNSNWQCVIMPMHPPK